MLPQGTLERPFLNQAKLEKLICSVCFFVLRFPGEYSDHSISSNVAIVISPRTQTIRWDFAK